MSFTRSLRYSLRRWQAAHGERAMLAKLDDHMRHDIGLPPRPASIRPHADWLLMPGTLR